MAIYKSHVPEEWAKHEFRYERLVNNMKKWMDGDKSVVSKLAEEESGSESDSDSGSDQDSLAEVSKAYLNDPTWVRQCRRDVKNLDTFTHRIPANKVP